MSIPLTAAATLSLSALIFSLFGFSGVTSEAEFILDTKELPPRWNFRAYGVTGKTRNGWQFNKATATRGPFYEVCDSLLEGADNLLESSYIDVSQLEQITLKILFLQSDCKVKSATSECSNSVQIMTRFVDKEDTMPRPLSEVIRDNEYQDTGKVLNIATNGSKEYGPVEREFVIDVRGRKGVYIAFRDKGSCTKIIVLQLVTYVCQASVLKLANYPKTFYAKEDMIVSALSCVEHASSNSGMDTANCKMATWESSMLPPKCSCDAGFEPTDQTRSCSACPIGMYKADHGNYVCAKCPRNSHATREGSDSCRCADGYYRAINASVETMCLRPPLGPGNLEAEVVNNDVVLKWRDSSFNRMGMQEHAMFFVVQCDLCTGERFRTADYKNQFDEYEYTLFDLRPMTQHLARVYAENSITEGQRNIAQYAEVTFTTGQKPAINNLEAETVEGSDKLLLTWRLDPSPAPRQLGSSPTHSFNIHVYREDRLQLIYTCRDTQYQLSCQPGSYFLKVCLEDDRICSAKLPLHIEDTVELLEPRGIVLAASIIMAVILLVLMVLLVSVWCYKRSHFNPHHIQFNGSQRFPPTRDWKLANSAMQYHVNATMSHPHATTEIGARMPFAGQGFIEPSACDEPEKILLEFSREIFMEQLQFHKDPSDLNSPGGCFSNLNTSCLMQKATLSTLDNQSCGVIVKSVSDNDPDALRLFFVEMSTLVQFYHPNVQMLHGTMLRPSEAVVCVESVSQGPLDAVLRENPMQFSLMQLVHILRGIACGMQYLAELGYVHKVLTCSNVLLTGTGVPKISGFEMRALLDHEEAAGAKPHLFSLLMTWMAPEVISHGLYSPHSDVYSFGVLMYEVLNSQSASWDAMNANSKAQNQQFPQTDSTNGPNAHKLAEEPANKCAASSNSSLSMSNGTSPSSGETSSCPQFLYDVIRHCLSQEHTQRPSFAQLRETLEKVVRNTSLLNEQYAVETSYAPLQSAALSNREMGPGQYIPLSAYYPAGLDLHNQQTSPNQTHLSTLKPGGEGKPLRRARVTPNATVEEWLVSLKLGQYTNLFYSRNLVYVKDLFGSTLSSLELLGIGSAKHRKRMVNSLRDLINGSTKSTVDKKKQSAVHIII
ncbi:ephrin type-A receptor 4-A-like isoform X2 [Symsagittifera roscoffensis]|uniref:ephrin type-A receptor 4-A-like isoform X2 n=1 Tax=Symsagittifera roscoffensis TaxID=84072 RepID=UPI00307BFEA7